MEFGGGINMWLAWGYVGFRIVHSLVQGTINIVPIRLSTLHAGEPVPDRAHDSTRGSRSCTIAVSSAEAGDELDMG